MTAKYIKTPVGKLPIRDHVLKAMIKMTDREIADQCFKCNFIDPEYFAELMDRGLSGRGISKKDTYDLINKREILILALEKMGEFKKMDTADCIENSKKQYSGAVKRLSQLAIGDTGGGRVAAQVLLSAYNGSAWQLDISDLCYLDNNYFNDSLAVMIGRVNLCLEPHTVIDNGQKIFDEIIAQWPQLQLIERAKAYKKGIF